MPVTVILFVACGGTGGDSSLGGEDISGTQAGGKGGSKGGAAGAGGLAGGAGGAGGSKAGAGGSKAGASGTSTGGAGGKAGASGTGGLAGKGGASGSASGAAGAAGAPCPQGQTICDGFSAKVCDGAGGFTKVTSCPTGCVPGAGCVACQPGTVSCNGDVAKYCKPDGSGFVTETCDTEVGVTCNPKTGKCEGPCAPENLSSSYLGCEYWPTTIANQVWSNFDFAVAVANPTGAKPANVKVTRGATVVATATVQPGALEIIKLPWVKEVKGPDFGPATNVVPVGPTRLVPGGAYRLRSDTPVSAYQFNALQYTLTPADAGYSTCPGLNSVGCNSYSNDASLLLPTNALTGNYRVFTYPAWNQASLPNYAAIVGTADDTSLTFTARTNTQAGGGLPALSAGGKATVKLNRGDVLEIMSNPTNADISGSLVETTKPVAVFAGHPCRFIPDGVQACDHIEETMLPIETLGKDYIMAAPAGANGQYELRVHGIDDGTTVTCEPPGPLGGSFTLSAGETKSFGVISSNHRLTANNRFYVSQYMIGETQAGKGDPAQSNGVPVAQYRDSYTFLAPNSYDSNFVTVTAPMTAAITLDGAPLSQPLTAVGSSGWGVARVQLSKSQVHSMSSNSLPFGIVVYGYGSFTSYMYPGGLNLSKL